MDLLAEARTIQTELLARRQHRERARVEREKVIRSTQSRRYEVERFDISSADPPSDLIISDAKAVELVDAAAETVCRHVFTFPPRPWQVAVVGELMTPEGIALLRRLTWWQTVLDHITLRAARVVHSRARRLPTVRTRRLEMLVQPDFARISFADIARSNCIPSRRDYDMDDDLEDTTVDRTVQLQRSLHRARRASHHGSGGATTARRRSISGESGTVGVDAEVAHITHGHRRRGSSGGARSPQAAVSPSPSPQRRRPAPLSLGATADASAGAGATMTAASTRTGAGEAVGFGGSGWDRLRANGTRATSAGSTGRSPSRASRRGGATGPPVSSRGLHELYLALAGGYAHIFLQVVSVAASSSGAAAAPDALRRRHRRRAEASGGDRETDSDDDDDDDEYDEPAGEWSGDTGGGDGVGAGGAGAAGRRAGGSIAAAAIAAARKRRGRTHQHASTVMELTTHNSLRDRACAFMRAVMIEAVATFFFFLYEDSESLKEGFMLHANALRERLSRTLDELMFGTLAPPGMLMWAPSTVGLPTEPVLPAPPPVLPPPHAMLAPAPSVTTTSSSGYVTARHTSLGGGGGTAPLASRGGAAGPGARGGIALPPLNASLLPTASAGSTATSLTGRRLPSQRSLSSHLGTEPVAVAGLKAAGAAAPSGGADMAGTRRGLMNRLPSLSEIRSASRGTPSSPSPPRSQPRAPPPLGRSMSSPRLGAVPAGGAPSPRRQRPTIGVAESGGLSGRRGSASPTKALVSPRNAAITRMASFRATAAGGGGSAERPREPGAALEADEWSYAVRESLRNMLTAMDSRTRLSLLLPTIAPMSTIAPGAASGAMGLSDGGDRRGSTSSIASAASFASPARPSNVPAWGRQRLADTAALRASGLAEDSASVIAAGLAIVAAAQAAALSPHDGAGSPSPLPVPIFQPPLSPSDDAGGEGAADAFASPRSTVSFAGRESTDGMTARSGVVKPLALRTGGGESAAGALSSRASRATSGTGSLPPSARRVANVPPIALSAVGGGGSGGGSNTSRTPLMKAASFSARSNHEAAPASSVTGSLSTIAESGARPGHRAAGGGKKLNTSFSAVDLRTLRKQRGSQGSVGATTAAAAASASPAPANKPSEADADVTAPTSEEISRAALGTTRVTGRSASVYPAPIGSARWHIQSPTVIGRSSSEVRLRLRRERAGTHAPKVIPDAAAAEVKDALNNHNRRRSWSQENPLDAGTAVVTSLPGAGVEGGSASAAANRGRRASVSSALNVMGGGGRRGSATLAAAAATAAVAQKQAEREAESSAAASSSRTKRKGAGAGHKAVASAAATGDILMTAAQQQRQRELDALAAAFKVSETADVPLSIATFVYSPLIMTQIALKGSLPVAAMPPGLGAAASATASAATLSSTTGVAAASGLLSEQMNVARSFPNAYRHSLMLRITDPPVAVLSDVAASKAEIAKASVQPSVTSKPVVPAAGNTALRRAISRHSATRTASATGRRGGGGLGVAEQARAAAAAEKAETAPPPTLNLFLMGALQQFQFDPQAHIIRNRRAMSPTRAASPMPSTHHLPSPARGRDSPTRSTAFLPPLQLSLALHRTMAQGSGGGLATGAPGTVDGTTSRAAAVATAYEHAEPVDLPPLTAQASSQAGAAGGTTYRAVTPGMYTSRGREKEGADVGSGRATARRSVSPTAATARRRSLDGVPAGVGDAAAVPSTARPLTSWRLGSARGGGADALAGTSRGGAASTNRITFDPGADVTFITGLGLVVEDHLPSSPPPPASPEPLSLAPSQAELDALAYPPVTLPIAVLTNLDLNELLDVRHTNKPSTERSAVELTYGLTAARLAASASIPSLVVSGSKRTLSSISNLATAAHYEDRLHEALQRAANACLEREEELVRDYREHEQSARDAIRAGKTAAARTVSEMERKRDAVLADAAQTAAAATRIASRRMGDFARMKAEMTAASTAAPASGKHPGIAAAYRRKMGIAGDGDGEVAAEGGASGEAGAAARADVAGAGAPAGVTTAATAATAAAAVAKGELPPHPDAAEAAALGLSEADIIRIEAEALKAIQNVKRQTRGGGLSGSASAPLLAVSDQDTLRRLKRDTGRAIVGGGRSGGGGGGGGRGGRRDSASKSALVVMQTLTEESDDDDYTWLERYEGKAMTEARRESEFKRRETEARRRSIIAQRKGDDAEERAHSASAATAAALSGSSSAMATLTASILQQSEVAGSAKDAADRVNRLRMERQLAGILRRRKYEMGSTFAGGTTSSTGLTGGTGGAEGGGVPWHLTSGAATDRVAATAKELSVSFLDVTLLRHSVEKRRLRDAILAQRRQQTESLHAMMTKPRDRLIADKFKGLTPEDLAARLSNLSHISALVQERVPSHATFVPDVGNKLKDLKQSKQHDRDLMRFDAEGLEALGTMASELVAPFDSSSGIASPSTPPTTGAGARGGAGGGGGGSSAPGGGGGLTRVPSSSAMLPAGMLSSLHLDAAAGAGKA